MAEMHSGMTTHPGKESNRLSIEEALSTLTHQCRSRPGLKLRPQSCEIRKSKKQKISDGKSYDIFWECRECPGPVPRCGEVQLETKPKEVKGGKKRRAASLKAKRKIEPPGPCNVCGRGPAETKFYPSQKTRCIECMKAMRKKAVAQPAPRIIPKEKSETMAEHAQKAAVLPGNPPREDAVIRTYECPTHGRHSGRMFGRSHSPICPHCYRERMKKHYASKSRGTAFEVPTWVRAWCLEVGSQRNVSPMEVLVGIVAAEIPSEWIKNWLMTHG